MPLTMRADYAGEVGVIETDFIPGQNEKFLVAYSNTGGKFPGLNLWGLSMPVGSSNYGAYQACGGIITQTSNDAGTVISFPYAFRQAPTVMITQYDDGANSGSNTWSTIRPASGPSPWLAGASNITAANFIFKSAVVIPWDPAILTDFTGLKAMYIAVGFSTA